MLAVIGESEGLVTRAIIGQAAGDGNAKAVVVMRLRHCRSRCRRLPFAGGRGMHIQKNIGLKAQHSSQGLLGNFERSNNWQAESDASGAIGWTQRDGGN